MARSSIRGGGFGGRGVGGLEKIYLGELLWLLSPLTELEEDPSIRLAEDLLPDSCAARGELWGLHCQTSCLRSMDCLNLLG